MNVRYTYSFIVYRLDDLDFSGNELMSVADSEQKRVRELRKKYQDKTAERKVNFKPLSFIGDICLSQAVNTFYALIFIFFGGSLRTGTLSKKY